MYAAPQSALRLRSDELVGLIVAVAAHLALGFALVVQAMREPAVIPPPERVTVSLAEDVAPVATAPQIEPEAAAAVAPVLADEPAPAPKVEVKKPEPPKPVPVPKATSVPKPKPKPQPTRTPPPPPAPKQGGGSRLNEDFLKGAGEAEAKSAGAPAVALGPAEKAALVQAVARQLKPKWRQPTGVDVDKLSTVIEWELNPDGSLKGAPRFVSQTGVTDSNRTQAGPHREAAIRAVRLAAPFRLPADYYAGWKKLRFTFDWTLN